MQISDLVLDESRRRREFPVAANEVFLAHAGVAPLPRVAVEALEEFARRGSASAQENDWTESKVDDARAAGAELLGCSPDEIALLGPTSVGLSLVANGLPWKPGDEVVYYGDDYPANVYPWTQLADRGVRPVALRPEHPGKITWDVVESALTERTRLVALATCHFLSGYRINEDEIGANLGKRGVLFCLDAIQTLGAFPMSVKHVDFLSADSHKWMLGPAGAGIVYVAAERMDLLRPTLLGSWNVVSPQFVAQEQVRFEPGARRYEPGMLNLPGIVGMEASMRLLLEVGIEAAGKRILEWRRAFLDAIRPMGYRLYIEACDLDPATTDAERSGILSVTHAGRDMTQIARALAAANIRISQRQNRCGERFIRFSPHFYNTQAELERVVEVMFGVQASACSC